MIQQSEAWKAERCGKITASRIGDLMATIKSGAPAASRRNYFNELLAERISGKANYKQVASLDRRRDLEPDARAAYEFYFGGEVEEVGFINHPTIERAGASPDGVIGTGGGLEIKCCDIPAHLAMIETGIIENGYLYQVQFGMACTGRSWWEFVGFQPDLPEELKLFRRRIERDDHAIARIDEAVREFDLEIEAKISAIKNNGQRRINGEKADIFRAAN